MDNEQGIPKDESVTGGVEVWVYDGEEYRLAEMLYTRNPETTPEELLGHLTYRMFGKYVLKRAEDDPYLPSS